MAVLIKVANNAKSVLASSITNIATSATVAAGEGDRFPVLGASEYFYATLEDSSTNKEIVKVTARTADTMTITRAQQGTTAISFAATSAFELRPTRDTFIEHISQTVTDTFSASVVLNTLV